MNAKIKMVLLALTIATATMAASVANAGSYDFTVSCPSVRKHVQWGIGDIDPGKEYLRVITGTRNPGCSVSDYNPSTDADLPTDRHSDVGGVIDALPPIAILKGILGL